MPSYTTSLRLVQPATGEYSGTWGTEVNNGLTALVDASIAGTSSITMTAANFTLTTANGASDQSRAMFLVLGGTPGASFAVIVPSVSKLYFVTNNTGFAQTVRTSGTGISVPNGASMTLRCDGTNVVVAQNYFLFTSGSAALPSVAFSGDADTGMWSPAANTLAWSNNGAETMRLDSSGNLGIGTSLPAQLFHAKKDQAAYTWARVDNQSSSASAYSGWMLGAFGNSWGMAIGSSAANSNALTWVIDAGGTNSEKMRLDSSGNLGIGTTSPGAKLEVASGNVLLSNTQSYAIKTAAGATCAVVTLTSGNVLELGGGGATDSIQFWNQGLERMRLDSSGNLGIGTSSPSERLSVNGNINLVGNGFLYSFNGGSSGQVRAGLQCDGTNQIVVFATATNERARINASGHLLLNQTSAGLVNSNSFSLEASNGYAVWNHPSSAASGSFFHYFGHNAGTIGSITQSGTTAVLYNTTSDRRLKTNIVDAPEAAALIDGIKVRSFDWISDGSHQRYGMVAQELAAVAPEAVHQPADPDEMMAVDYSKLVPMLIKEIQSLRARVAALEAA
jgi:hypothetical protein